MKNKQDDKYFRKLKMSSFFEFMNEYIKLMKTYSIMIDKCERVIEGRNCPSKNHMLKMRQKTIDIEKFGRQFRRRTIEMSKIKVSTE